MWLSLKLNNPVSPIIQIIVFQIIILRLTEEVYFLLNYWIYIKFSLKANGTLLDLDYNRKKSSAIFLHSPNF